MASRNLLAFLHYVVLIISVINHKKIIITDLYLTVYTQVTVEGN